MNMQHVGRGRPKGSGIDDRDRLQIIAGMLAADPTLKPTTAIKQLGISDPSIIRRLRDKFQAAEARMSAERRPETRSAPAPTIASSAPTNISEATASPITKSSSRAVAAPAPRAATKTAPIIQTDAPSKAAFRVVESDRPVLDPDPFETFAIWLGVGFSAIGLAVKTQAAIVESILNLPPVATALRQQVAFNDLVIACSNVNRKSRLRVV